MEIRKPKFENRNFREAGVTLLLAVLIMSMLLLVATSVALLSVQQIRSSRAFLVSEPAFQAAKAGAEEGLWVVKRQSLSNLPDCPAATEKNFPASHSFSSYCKFFEGGTFNVAPGTPVSIMLYNPNDPHGDTDLSEFPYGTLRISNTGGFSATVDVSRIDGTSIRNFLASPNNTYSVFLPQVAAGREGRVQVTLSASGGGTVVDVTTDKGIPNSLNIASTACSSKKVGINSCDSSAELYTRKIEITMARSGGMSNNVALASNGATATASSSIGGYVPAYAINGDETGAGWLGGTGGWNDNTLLVFPDWLQIDFNGSQTINRIKVVTLQDNYANPIQPTDTMTFALYGNTSFDIQYYDGSSWVTVPGGSVTGNNLVVRNFTFPAVITSSVRVLIHSTPDGRYSRVIELEAFTP